MPVVQNSWLYKNSARNYPLHDKADPSVKSAVVDCHITFPLNVPQANSRVFFSKITVTNEYASLVIELDGVGVLATFEVLNPVPYRMYGLTTSGSEITGFVTFGDAALNDTIDVDATLTVDTGEILESRIYRYVPSNINGFLADNQNIEGTVLFKGENGVVAEIVEVYYDLENATHLSLVFRMERDPSVMVDPIPECSLLLESGVITDLISSINGVRPDTLGRVYLEFEGEDTLLYDAEGNIVVDDDGNPVYDSSTAVLELAPSGLQNVIGFKDNLDYNKNCASKNQKKITYATSKCEQCTPAIDEVQGTDGAGGNAVSLAGAYVLKDKLTVLWNCSGVGDLTAGTLNNILIQVDEGADPVSVSGGTVIEGTSPTLPGRLENCEREHTTAGDIGKLGKVEYNLSRELEPGEKYALDIAAGVVSVENWKGDQEDNREVKTCTLSAQSELGALTPEEQQKLDEGCY